MNECVTFWQACQATAMILHSYATNLISYRSHCTDLLRFQILRASCWWGDLQQQADLDLCAASLHVTHFHIYIPANKVDFHWLRWSDCVFKRFTTEKRTSVCVWALSRATSVFVLLFPPFICNSLSLHQKPRYISWWTVWSILKRSWAIWQRPHKWDSFLFM